MDFRSSYDIQNRKLNITIAQFNIQSLNNKKALLENFLYEKDIDICMLNETWLKSENTNFSVSGYNIVLQNGPGGHGGVAILIKNSFKYSVIHTPYYDFLQTAAINLKTNAGNLTLLCAYAPPNCVGRRFKCRKLKQIIDTLPKPIMLSGDLNAHHVAFGCRSSNTRGNDVYNLLDECDLCILNTGSPTTVGTIRSNPSSIDITCVSPDVAPLCEWTVHEDPMGSYHFPILVDIQISVQKYVTGTPSERFNYRQADWSKFSSESEKAFDNINYDQSPLEIYNSFCDILNSLKHNCIPKIVSHYPYKMKTPAPWWDKECADAVNNSRSALRNYRSNPTIPNYIEYKKVDALKKKLLSQKKKDSWRSLCEAFNRYTPVSMIWNHIRRFKRAGCRKSSKNDEWIPSFVNKFAPLSPPEKDIDTVRLNTIFDSPGKTEGYFLTEPFNFNEFKMALNSRKDTTPGLDDISYKLIKQLHPKAQNILLNTYNLLWENGCIPEAWKTQCVIPILKPDKPENDCDSYRPISLSSCIGKLFENMLKLRLEFYYETYNILPQQQFGFRKGKSASENYISLITDIKNSFFNHSYTACAFLDVCSAFDNVNPTILIQILNQAGIPGKICKWIFNFLYNRTMYVKFNNIVHGPRQVYKGTMQGSTISPLLFGIYTSQINEYLTDPSVKCLLFADDIVVYSVNKDVNMAIRSLNKGLSQILNFYNSLSLKINVNKSEAMIFSKKDVYFDDIQKVNYDGSNLNWVKEKKFLGIYLDTKLKFETHINYIIGNASRGLNILRSLAGVHWGSDPNILSMLYKSIVRSHFDYSSLAYMNANISYLKKLDVIQNKALRIITGAMCSTPINAMEAETNIVPLSLRRLQICQKLCLKLLATNNSIVINRLIPCNDLPAHLTNNINFNSQDLFNDHQPELLKTFMNVKNLCNNLHTSNLLPVFSAGYQAVVQTETIIDFEKLYSQTEFLEYLNSQSNVYTLYTDGSKTSDIVTSAFYDPQTKQTLCIKLDTQCSIFTAECYAIYCALLHINDIINRTNFLIISDSKSVLLALVGNLLRFSSNFILYNIKRILLELRNRGKCVTFKWVPSHCGISGNEIADKATRTECNEDHTNIVGVPFTDYHQKLRENITLLWHSYWKMVSEQKGKWYASIQSTPPQRPWYHKWKNIDCRNFITVINRLRFGHCRTPAHLARLKIVQNEECETCTNEVANLEHIVMKCQKFNLERLVLVSELQSVCENSEKLNEVPSDLNKLLSEPNFFRPIYKFIANTVGKI